MSKFAKALIITSCIIFFTGVVLAITSLALGANPKLVGNRLNSMGLSDIYFWGHERFYSHSYDYDYDYDYDFDYSFDDTEGLNLPEAPEKPEPAEPPTPGEYEITSLYFDFDAGDINITQGEDFALIYGNSRAQRFFYENREGSTWTVGSRDNWKIFDFWRHNGDKLRLTVVLPADFVAERMDIYMGAGNLHVTALRATEMYLDVGLGNCQIGELLAGNVDLNVGLGNLEARSFHADNSRLEVGMGAMKLDVSQPLSQYRYDLSVGLGNVQLGKNSYNGVADISAGNDDSPYEMTVNCGMGSITVRENLPTTI